jgi:hypothetical protein
MSTEASAWRSACWIFAQRRVKARVLDRDRGPGGEDRRRFLVVLVELGPAPLLGHVQVAEGLAPDLDRNPEERVHRRVAGGKPVGMRVAVHVPEAERGGIADQLTEDPAAARQAADLPFGLVVDADVDEALQLLALAIEDTQRRVLGVGQLPRRLNHRVQNRLEVELREKRGT